jgi:hypothetical protein
MTDQEHQSTGLCFMIAVAVLLVLIWIWMIW